LVTTCRSIPTFTRAGSPSVRGGGGAGRMGSKG
jgi:hypothetical protein